MFSADRSLSTSRRRFLQCLGAGAALAALPAAADEAAPPGGAHGPSAKLKLGLASYTTKDFSLDETIVMCKRVGLEYLCLKSFHLPLDASAEVIASAAEKVRKAGLVLYGGGVIAMQNAAQVDQAFAYAKAAGMATIVGMPVPEMLPLVDKKVREFDIRVAIHNHGQEASPNYWCPEKVLEHVQPRGPRIGVCGDVGYWMRSGVDPVAAVRLLKDRLFDVQVHDLNALTPEGTDVPWGTGAAPLADFFRELRVQGVRPIIGVEYSRDFQTSMPQVRENVAWFNRLVVPLAQ